jgi:hypothetical protein
MQNNITFLPGTISTDEKLDKPHEGIPNRTPIPILIVPSYARDSKV